MKWVMLLLGAVLMVSSLGTNTHGAEPVSTSAESGGIEITLDCDFQLGFTPGQFSPGFLGSSWFLLDQTVRADWESFFIDALFEESALTYGVTLNLGAEVLSIRPETDPGIELTLDVSLESSVLPSVDIDLLCDAAGTYGPFSASGSMGIGVWPFGGIEWPTAQGEWRFFDTSRSDQDHGLWFFGDMGALVRTSPGFGAGLWLSAGVGLGNAQADLRFDFDPFGLSFISVKPEFQLEGDFPAFSYTLAFDCEVFPAGDVTVEAEASCTFHTVPREPPNRPPVAEAAARAEIDKNRLGEPEYSIGVGGGRMIVPAGVPVELSGLGSYDPDGEDIDFVWKIAGETHEGATVSFTFPVAGEWDAVLTVYDPHAARDVALPIRIEVVELAAGDGLDRFKKYCNNLAAVETVAAGTCTTIAAVGAVVPEPVISKAAAAAFGIQAGLHAVASGVFWLLANDPDDLDYENLATPITPSLAAFEDPDVPSAIVEGINALDENLLEEVAVLRAALSSLERANAALEAGDLDWRARHVETLLDLVRQLYQLQAARPALRAGLENAWIDAGWPTLGVEETQVISAQESLTNGQVPDALQNTLVALSDERTSSDDAIERIVSAPVKEVVLGGQFPGSWGREEAEHAGMVRMLLAANAMLRDIDR